MLQSVYYELYAAVCDIANLATTSLPAGVQAQLKAQVAEVAKQRTEVSFPNLK